MRLRDHGPDAHLQAAQQHAETCDCWRARLGRLLLAPTWRACAWLLRQLDRCARRT